jgi:acetamidase/formamidase
VAIHDIPLERRTLHRHFSPDLEPILTVEPGDSVRFATLDAGWGLEPAPDPERPTERARFELWDPDLDDGHPLIGPVDVRGARAGQTLAVTIDSVRVGLYGFTNAGGWESPLNERLGVASGDTHVLWWQLDADAEVACDRLGRTVALRPFLGVLGMPPAEHGMHSTIPPRPCGGNLDCTELVPGSTLYLPVPVDGGLFSAGDGHGRQGDGEVSGLAIECPLEQAQLTLDVREDLPITTPVAETRQVGSRSGSTRISTRPRPGRWTRCSS